MGRSYAESKITNQEQQVCYQARIQEFTLVGAPWIGEGSGDRQGPQRVILQMLQQTFFPLIERIVSSLFPLSSLSLSLPLPLSLPPSLFLGGGARRERPRLNPRLAMIKIPLTQMTVYKRRA